MTNPQVLEIKTLREAQEEFARIGVQPAATPIMGPKALFRAVKVKGLAVAAANIIKQEMLSRGGEAAVASGALNHAVATTDLLLLGTLSQFQKLFLKLRQHQFGLPCLADEIEKALNHYSSFPEPMEIGGRTFAFGSRTYLMGVVNVTPDSFSDGGRFLDPAQAVEQALRLAAEGADMIDVGGESTRPGAGEVPLEVELQRVLPVIKGIREKNDLPISIDTRKAAVAEAALGAGANLVNDVSALRFDAQMAKVISESGVPVCLMHMRGIPATMQEQIVYQDLLQEILDFLKQSIEIAKNAGILERKIIVDPGIGFGKSVGHNLEILRRLGEFKVLGRPILVGTSRKGFIGKVLNLEVGERLEGTAASVAAAAAGGADIVRVHEVGAMKRVVSLTDAIFKNGGMR